MNSIAKLICLTLTATFSAAAIACGVCIEDKVAATYDHAVVMRAAAKHQLLVFGEIEGAVDVKATTDKITRAAPHVRGIDRSSIRTSVSPAAFSFALDPASRPADAAVAELQKKLRADGVKLTVLRVMRSDARTSRN